MSFFFLRCEEKKKALLASMSSEGVYRYSIVYGKCIVEPPEDIYVRAYRCIQCEKNVTWMNVSLDEGKLRCDECFMTYLRLVLSLNDDHYRPRGAKRSKFEIVDMGTPLLYARRFIVYRDYPLSYPDTEFDGGCGGGESG